MEEAAWLQPSYPGNASRANCTDGCMNVKLVTTLAVPQHISTFGDYKNYPFDTHMVRIPFTVTDAAVNCTDAFVMPRLEAGGAPAGAGGPAMAPGGALSASEIAAQVRPPSGDWRVRDFEPVRLLNVVDRGVEQANQCELQVFLERNSGVHIVKSLMLSVITVLACLLANFLHPAEHTGDRAAIVLVAGLILTANIQAELGLGPINYLIWLDGFNLILIVVTLLALVQTVFVHRKWAFDDQQGYALSIDRICTNVLMLFMFPLAILGDVLLAFDRTFGLGVILLVAAPTVGVGMAYCLVQRREKGRDARERNAIRSLAALPGGGTDAQRQEELIRHVFDVFDSNESGSLSAYEFRRLVRALYPTASLEVLSPGSSPTHPTVDQHPPSGES